MRKIGAVCLTLSLASPVLAQKRYPLPYPPKLPGDKLHVSHRESAFLKPGPNLRPGVRIAKTLPKIDFMFYPNQDYPGNPWSFRAVGTARGDKYYSALCDHLAPRGTAYLFEYDATKKTFRLLVNTAKFLRASRQIPPTQIYSPGEVQTRIDFGRDGWLYYGTTRGSTRATTDANGFRGEWVLRTHPGTAKTEVVAAYPVPKHCHLASVLDPMRMIFYGGTAAGDYRVKDVRFFAVDVRTGKVLKVAKNGFDRYAIFAPDTGRVYWEGHRYDPTATTITPSVAPHVRSATQATVDGRVYGTSHRSATLWMFNTKTEKLETVGEGAVGTQSYVSAIHIDPTGRYLYYLPGAHGGASKDGTPVVQYDTKTRTRKVLAFLHAFFRERYRYNLDGCFCSVLDPKGEKLYLSWDGWREGQSGPRMESAALTVLHIPPDERRP